MDAMETIHLSAKDLCCPVCYFKYNLAGNQPMSLNCGHNICSQCLRRVKNCPLCRARIRDRSSYSKNVFISCIIEQKEKIKECSVHNRPLEFFCKEHKILICVDCAIEGGHFSHNFVRCRDVDTRAQKLKGLMKKLDTKDEQSNKQFKTFLGKEKTLLKKRIDDFLDEYLEPLMTVKKKLHKEVDTFIMAQNSTYEKQTYREGLIKWKNDSEGLVSQWEATGEAEAASKIVDNETEEIEKKINGYETQLEEIQGKTQHNMGTLLKDIKNKMTHTKGAWKKLNRKIEQVMSLFKKEIDPRVEKEYLMECLKEYDVLANWIEGEQLEVKMGSRDLKVKDFDEKNFDCTLEKLSMDIQKVYGDHFEVICKILQSIMSLTDLKVVLRGIHDNDLPIFADSLQKMRELERLNVAIVSEEMKENSFAKFLSALPHLTKLKALQITLESCEELTNEKMNELENIFDKLKTLTEFSLHLVSCDNITNDGVVVFLQSLQNSSNITKLDLALSDCRYLNYKAFEPLSKVFAKLTNIEELSLAFESFCEISNPIAMTSLALGILSLPKLRKLHLSFADNIYLPAYIIRRFFTRITEHNPKITEFVFDLSRCQDVMNTTLESIGLSLTQLTHMNTLVLKFKCCKISEKGVRSILSNISKIESLRSFTLDCRHCKVDVAAQNRMIEQMNKMTRLTESTLLFGCQDGAAQKNERKFSGDTERSGEFGLGWSPLESDISFEAEDAFDFDDYNGDLIAYEELPNEREWDFNNLDELEALYQGHDNDDDDDDDDDEDENENEMFYHPNDFAIMSIQSSEDSDD